MTTELPRNPGYGSMHATDDGTKLRGTCPECAREGLVLLFPNLILPRHKPQPDESLWWNPRARGRDGFCGGGGRSYAEFGQPGKGAAEGSIA